MKVLAIWRDEAYPVYGVSVQERGAGGWIPEVELSLETLSEDDLKDYEKVEALYGAWQDRLGVLYRANAKPLTSHLEDPGQLPENVND